MYCSSNWPISYWAIYYFSTVDHETYLHQEEDPRYRGAAIPSRAFRFLQNMTDSTDATVTSAGKAKVTWEVKMKKKREKQTWSETDTLLFFFQHHVMHRTSRIRDKTEIQSRLVSEHTSQKTLRNNYKERFIEFDALLVTQKKRRRTCRRASNKSLNRRNIWVVLFLHDPSGYYRRWQHQKVSVSILMEKEGQILTISWQSGIFESATNVNPKSFTCVHFLSFFWYKRSPLTCSRRREQFFVTFSWPFFSLYV